MIDEFLNYLKYEKRRSPLTVNSYEADLKTFETYLKSLDTNLSWSDVKTTDIRMWLENMMDNGNTATTINRRLSALRSLYKFAKAHNLLEMNPTENLTGPKRAKLLPQFLKEKEINTLLDNFKWGSKFVDVRDRTIIIMFYETGMRLSELLKLKTNDISFITQEVKVTGKRNKQRIIPFGNSLKAELMHYIDTRNQQTPRLNDALFVNRQGTEMSAVNVRERVKKYLSLVTTLKKKSPHVLRHTFATTLLNNDAQLESVKELLGHAQLNTTEIYTHTTFEHLKKVYGNAHPRAHINKIKKG